MRFVVREVKFQITFFYDNFLLSTLRRRYFLLDCMALVVPNWFPRFPMPKLTWLSGVFVFSLSANNVRRFDIGCVAESTLVVNLDRVKNFLINRYAQVAG